jgi:hypothetical protein
MLKTFKIKYWAWPEGARIKTTGEFEIAGESEEDVKAACQVRWPEMIITSCDEAS